MNKLVNGLWMCAFFWCRMLLICFPFLLLGPVVGRTNFRSMVEAQTFILHTIRSVVINGMEFLLLLIRYNKKRLTTQLQELKSATVTLWSKIIALPKHFNWSFLQIRSLAKKTNLHFVPSHWLSSFCSYKWLQNAELKLCLDSLLTSLFSMIETRRNELYHPV